jgi:hypothetical protein
MALRRCVSLGTLKFLHSRKLPPAMPKLWLPLEHFSPSSSVRFKSEKLQGIESNSKDLDDQLKATTNEERQDDFV